MAIREAAANAPVTLSLRSHARDAQQLAIHLESELAAPLRALSLVADWVEHRQLAITASYEIIDETVIFADATAAPIVVTLPASDTGSINRDVHIKKTDATTNAVTITPRSPDTIDGMSSVIITTEGQSFHLIADGLGLWRILSTVAASGGGGVVSPATIAPVIVNFTAAAVGVSVKYAREDHRHKLDSTINATGADKWTGSHNWAPTANAVPVSITATGALTSAHMQTWTPVAGTADVVTRLGYFGIGETIPTAMLSIRGRASALSVLTLTPDIWLDAQTSLSSLSDGASVTTWPDLSGNSKNFIADAGADGAPGYRTTGFAINGIGAVNFNGDVDDLLKYATEAVYAGAYTIALVFRADSGVLSGPFNAFGRHPLATTNYGVNFPAVTSPNPINVFYVGSSYAMTGSVSFTAGSAHYVIIRRDGSNVHRVWLDGVEVTLGSPLTQSGSMIVGGLFCLDFDSLAQPTNSIGEFITFASALSLGDVANLNDYLAGRWGFAGAGASVPLQDWKEVDGTIDSIVDAAINLGLGTAAPRSKLEVVGNLTLAGSAGGFYTRLATGAQAVNITYTLPPANVDGLLLNDGAGVLTWETFLSLGLVSGSGTTDRIPRWLTPTLLGDSQFRDAGGAFVATLDSTPLTADTDFYLQAANDGGPISPSYIVATAGIGVGLIPIIDSMGAGLLSPDHDPGTGGINPADAFAYYNVASIKELQAYVGTVRFIASSGATEVVIGDVFGAAGGNGYFTQMISGGQVTFNIVGAGSHLFTFGKNVAVPDDPYAVGWNGSVNVPTKNAVYDKIELVIAGAQPLDTDLTEIAAVANVRGDLLLTNAGPTWTRLAIGAAGTVLRSDGTDAAWATLATAGAQPLDATLTAFAALTIALDSLTIGTGADAFTQVTFAANTFPAKASMGALVAKTITDFGLSLVDDTNAAAAQTTLGLVIGTNVQAFDADLGEIAAVANVRGDILITDSGPTWVRLAKGTATQVLTSDGTDIAWATPAAAPVGANPTGTIGVAAVNGSATTFLRSDGAPAFDMTIARNWTAGVHTFAVQDVHTLGISLSTSGIIQSDVTSGASNISVLVRSNAIKMASGGRQFEVQWYNGTSQQALFQLYGLAPSGLVKEMKLLYDTSNYAKAAVAATGAVTYSAVGTAPSLTFTATGGGVGAVQFNADTTIGLAGTILNQNCPSMVMADGCVISNAANVTGLTFGASASDVFNFYGPATRTKAGASSAFIGRPVAAIKQDTTQTGNTAITETDLFSYSVPAATLNTNGESVSFEYAGTFANSINTKQIKVKFGATTIFDSGALAITGAGNWTIEGRVIRTGATTQKCYIRMTTTGATLGAYNSYSTAAETLSGAVTLKVTGTATGASDIVGEVSTVDWRGAA